MRLRELTDSIRRLPIARGVEGATIGIALWCILYAFQLLPGIAADTPGVVLFGIAGLVLRISQFGPILAGVLVAAAAAVFVVTETSISNVLASRWVRADQFPDSGVQAVVVLSAGLNANGTINGPGLDHLLSGLELIRAGKAKLLVTTTVRQQFPAAFLTSEADQARIVGLSGALSQWERVAPGKSTRDEAVNSARSLIPRGIKHVAVVADPLHTRRACGAFEAVGFGVVCVPARARSPGAADPGPWPADRLTVFGDWVYEVLATAQYRARGWLTTDRAVLQAGRGSAQARGSR